MDLRTAHGRAQAIADGGQAGELARLVEDALGAHSNERETLCGEMLNGITIEVFDARLWQDKVDLLYQQMCRGEANPSLVKKDLEEFGQTLHCRLEKAARQLVEAQQILEGE